jgi:hypothetical protein
LPPSASIAVTVIITDAHSAIEPASFSYEGRISAGKTALSSRDAQRRRALDLQTASLHRDDAGFAKGVG